MMATFNVVFNKRNVHIVSTLSNGHKILGWALVVLASVEIYYGWDIFHDDFDDDRRWIAYTGYAILLFLYALLEVNH